MHFSGEILPTLGNLCAKLAAERWLTDTRLLQFANRAAYYMGELNAIHPFRDGNGRTQRDISREQMTHASQDSFQRGDNTGLQKLLEDALN